MCKWLFYILYVLHVFKFFIYRNYYSNDYQGFIMDGWISEVIQPTWWGDMYF